MPTPDLSIVIPAFNEEARIVGTLESVTQYLAASSLLWELVVVDDGSSDGTAALVAQWAENREGVRLESIRHQGKGAAVRHGMLAASGRYRFLCDADLAMPIDELAKFIPPGLTDTAVAVGSREADGSRRYDEPAYRHLMGRVFNMLVRGVAVRGIRDTQCGFKCFSAAAAERLFPLQRLDGFGFDVEVLFLAQKANLRVQEVPINWYYQTESKVRPVKDTLRMLADALAVRWNHVTGKYSNEPPLGLDRQ